jgi:malate dehydrogenase (oxaloacetate-decarboxylating)(NADP+)
MDKGGYFMTDTYVSYDPPAQEIAETTIRAANHIRRFGIEPKAAWSRIPISARALHHRR